MTFRRLVPAVMLLMTATFASFGRADDYTEYLRCGPNLIMVGETKLEVFRKCGNPVMREDVPVTTSWGYKYEEEWTYDMGPNDFLYVLRFDGSKLKTIHRGNRGFAR